MQDFCALVDFNGSKLKIRNVGIRACAGYHLWAGLEGPPIVKIKEIG